MHQSVKNCTKRGHFLVWPLSHPISLREWVLDQSCSLPPGGEQDILASVLRSRHDFHLYIVSSCDWLICYYANLASGLFRKTETQMPSCVCFYDFQAEGWANIIVSSDCMCVSVPVYIWVHDFQNSPELHSLLLFSSSRSSFSSWASLIFPFKNVTSCLLASFHWLHMQRLSMCKKY